jgi:opacity protein-like surface antigen
MSLVRVALSALGGAILASSAMAADYVAAVPPPQVWGFYFGGGVCYDWANFDIDKDIYKRKKVRDENGHPVKVNNEYVYEFKHEHNIGLFDIAAEAPCATVTVGYDYQIDQLFVIGIFASYDWQDKHGEITKTKEKQNGPQTYTLATASLGNIATVGGRAGVLVQPDLLVYFLLGYSWSDASFSVFPDWGGPTVSGNVSGPTIGGGIEKLFHTNWSARLEYRYTDFGKLSTGIQPLWGKYYYEKSAHITDQSIRFVLTYRP